MKTSWNLLKFVNNCLQISKGGEIHVKMQNDANLCNFPYKQVATCPNLSKYVSDYEILNFIYYTNIIL